MALSGTITGKVTQNSDSFTYYAKWTATQDIKNNETTITVKHYWGRTGSATFDSTAKRRYGITIDGEPFEDEKRMDYSPWVTTPISTATHTVKHNDDGTKSITISTYANGRAGSYGPSNGSGTSGDCTASATITLDPIPRAAQLLTATNFTDETNPTITYDNPAGTAANVQVAICDTTGSTQYAKYRSISQNGSSYTFNLTDAEKQALIEALPSGKNQMYVNIYMKTYMDGSTTPVENPRYLTRIFEVVNSKPEITCTLTDTGTGSTALTNDSKAIIKGFNYISATMSAPPKKGATIVSKSITNGTTTINSDTAGFSNVESNEFIFYVKDSFGNEVTKVDNTSLTLIPYTKLTCNISTNPPTADGDLAVKISGNYFNSTFGSKGVANTLTVKWRIKENDNTYDDWVTITPTITNNSYVANFNLTGLNYKSTYTVQAMATDKVSTGGILSPERVTKSSPVYNWGEDNFDINVPLTVDDITGNNVFTGQLEVGSYDSNTGAEQTNTSCYRNTDYIEVTENTSYIISVDNVPQRFIILYYDTNKTFLYETRGVDGKGIFATPSNTKYINFRCYQDDFTANYANLTIQIRKTIPTFVPSPGNLIDLIYPVGSIYITVNSTNPQALFGGTWEQIKGRFLLGTGTPDANSDNYFGGLSGRTWNAGVGSTGGEDFHTLTVAEMPSHRHEGVKWFGNQNLSLNTSGSYDGYGLSNWTTKIPESYSPLYTAYTGGNAAFAKMPPYFGVYIWKRTA